MKYTRADFPEGFLFGAATSSYQIEGHAFGAAGETQWDTFAATPGNVVRNENGRIACDHYHRYEEDFDLLADTGVDCYRFSTSWARILPDGRGTPNPEGLDFYDRVIDALLERGLKPCVTLYHWELPSPLLDLGGWKNRDIADWFADYTQVIMGRIGDRTYSVAPINEPWCVAWLSHFMGHHAPGLRDIRATARAMHHVLLAHGTAIRAMRGLGVGNLGAVCNLEYAHPVDNTPEAEAAAARYDAYYNRFYLSGMFKREYPAEVLEGMEAHLPKNWQDDFDTIAIPVDWCGLNYYTRKVIAPNDGPWPSLDEVEGPLPKTFMNWEIYPDGLEILLKRTHAEYTKGLPLIVAENGMANADAIENGKVNDQSRIAYLNQHLDAVRNALAAGVPVGGYYVWSLLDNYEWALGYEKRFGLIHVDFDTLKRTPKASYEAFKAALRAPLSARSGQDPSS
ncbi:MAG: GH1 family beta-glucosidase [Pseudomonadota bacterium]